jgi:signal transduction histidine kinase
MSPAGFSMSAQGPSVRGVASCGEEPLVLTPPEAATINILIVDDEERNLTVLETVLSDPSYRLVRSLSADQALLALTVDEFALLILDVNMPGMSGFELATIIKARKKTAFVPIIFLTAFYNEDAHVLEGYGTGAVDYLHKPVNATVLRSKVAIFADLYRKSREIELANRVLNVEVNRRRIIQDQLSALNDGLEQRVAERTAALQQNDARLRQANQALEQFAYAASHDLQEPLRNVAVYAELFRKRYGVGLCDEANSFLETITEGARRAARMVSDLLAYTQSSDSRDQQPASVDAQQIVDRVLRNLEHSIEEARATITTDTLPSVPIREFHLEQILQNLIGNALKYRRDDNPPVVTISSRLEENAWRFDVRDNGIGFEPIYSETIFGVFKRLHGVGKYSGTGIGLAICKKIVESYGGRMWAESEPNTGSVFHFTVRVDADKHEGNDIH